METEVIQHKPTTAIELVKVGIRYWPLLVLGTMTGAGIGFIINRQQPDKFTAKTLIQIDVQATRPTGALGNIADLIQSDSKAETEVELFQSRAVLGDVVDSMGLFHVAKSKGLLRNLVKRPGVMELAKLKLPPRELNSDYWTAHVSDSDMIELRDPAGKPIIKTKVGNLASEVYEGDTVSIQVKSLNAKQGESFIVYSIPRSVVIDGLQAALRVSEKGRRTGILEAKLTTSKPERARDVLNAIAITYIRHNAQKQTAQTQKTLDYLQAKMPVVRHNLDSLEEILKNYKSDKGTIDLGSETRTKLAENSEMQQKLLGLKERREDLLRLYKEDHPNIVAVDAQIQQVKAALNSSNQQVKKIPLTQQAFSKISRDVNVNTELYSALLNNIQQLQVVQGGEAGSARIVDYAELPVFPSGPSRKPIFLICILLGFGATYGAIYFANYFRSGISSAKHIERITEKDVLAEIPFSGNEKSNFKKNKGQKSFLSVTFPSDAAVEEMRGLRTRLALTALKNCPSVLSVTSIDKEEGKTFFASNLSILFAQMGRRVLLIDADLRTGRIAEVFGSRQSNGLSEYLNGHLPENQIIQDTTIPNLYLIASGTTPTNPTELLGRQQFKTMIQGLQNQFDLIILDTPPVLSVSDTYFPMSVSTASMLILNSGKHKMEEIQEAFQRMNQSGIENVSVVMNKC